jgi:hypothetical protein
MTADRPDRVICILGMHRSGTSALTGSLEQQGLFLGKRNVSAEHNLRGNRENPEIMQLHEALLESNGGAWMSPPERVDWKPEHLEWARQILATYAGHAVWGFKDPRSLLTMEGWRKLVPNLEHVGIFRHPLRVAASLNRRNQFPAELGVALWRQYNQRLIAAHRHKAFPILCFDDEEADLGQKLVQLGRMLELEPSVESEPFFADELRRAELASATLPEPVRVLYDDLRALAL